MSPRTFPAESLAGTGRDMMAKERVRLAIDARVWKTGIGTYTLSLLAAIRQIDSGIRMRAIVRADAVGAISSLCDEIRIVDAPIYTLQEQWRIPPAVRDCDLLHVPHYNVPVLYSGPLVVTIHDLTHLTEPSLKKTARALAYAWPMLHFAARRASHVITVSEYSKKGIVERLGISAEKVSVIYNGVGPQFRPMDREEAEKQVKVALGIERPYLLYVGNMKPHKNLGMLTRSFAGLRSRGYLDHLLLLVGDDRTGRQRVLEECRRLGVGDAVRHIPWLSEEMLPHVYGAADVVVMPSTSEGFGLPVLEAMACGIPVACSNAASLPEVGGDGVVYFDPSSDEQMADAIESILESTDLRMELREKGPRQASKFTWEECARKHLEVYRECVPRPAPKRVTGTPGSRYSRRDRDSLVPARSSRPGVRIGLNISTASDNPAGIGNYAFQLAKHLPSAAPDLEWIFFGPDPALVPMLSRKNARAVAMRGPRAVRVLWEQTVLPLTASKEGTALLHGTDFSRPIAYDGLAINTIHDLSAYADPRFFPAGKRFYKQTLIPLAARNSSAIITVSEFSRKEILNRFPSSEDRVFAIHHGVDPASIGRTSRQGSSRPFLLFVGTLEHRKNLVALIQVFRVLHDRRKIPYRLILAGKPGFGWRAIRAAIRENCLSDEIEMLGYVEQDELLKLYQSADLFVYPSVYEGFGLPLLEAMAHGTPVVSSNSTSLPEVGGDAVVYFDPHNREEMVCAIERVLDSPTLQAELSEKGRKRAAIFTWEECARKHVEVYRKVLSQ